MQKQTGSSQRRIQGSRTIKAMIAGLAVPVAIDSLKSDQFTMHHGTTPAGKQINSLGSLDIGDTTFVRKQNGQKHDYNMDEFDLMSVQRLEAKGYKITPPNANAAS